MKYIETLQDKKLVALEKKQLKESMLELAGILSSANTQAPRDLTVKIDELTNAVIKAITELRNDTTVPDKIADDYQKIADYVIKANKEQSSDLKEVAEKIVTAVESIKLPAMPKIPAMPEINIPAFPKINIPAPIVNIPKNDFSPIARAIDGLKQEKGIDLSDFRPHDIVDADSDTQYIGFVSPSGQWYVIENKVKENTIRYVFGKDNYSEAFANAGSYKYKLLSEATDAL